MTYSFNIPLSALFDAEGDLKVGFKTEQEFNPVPHYDFLGNQHVDRLQTVTRHYIGINGEWFEVYLSTEKDDEDADVLTFVTFTGFRETCERVQQLLELSLPIE